MIRNSLAQFQMSSMLGFTIYDVSMDMNTCEILRVLAHIENASGILPYISNIYIGDSTHQLFIQQLITLHDVMPQKAMLLVQYSIVTEWEIPGMYWMTEDLGPLVTENFSLLPYL